MKTPMRPDATGRVIIEARSLLCGTAEKILASVVNWRKSFLLYIYIAYYYSLFRSPRHRVIQSVVTINLNETAAPGLTFSFSIHCAVAATC